MEKATIIGIDLAKRIFQLHGAASDGSVVFRKKIRRDEVLVFLAAQSPCLVAMEACGSAHYWAREITGIGHEVKLIPPTYVKPFVKRHKNDAADAEAITEAAARPTMRTVAVKTAEQQARAMVFRTRDLLVRQRTQLINALRGHLAEFGIVAPQGPAYVKRLAEAIDDDTNAVPDVVRRIGQANLDEIAALSARVAELETELRKAARESEVATRSQTMPGVGPVTAMAIEAFAPPMESFKTGRAFAAWLGLVPKQRSSGGKPRLGRASKMGQRDIRRLLIMGAMTLIRWGTRRGASQDPWLAQMLARKPRLVVAIALANRMARRLWAMLTKNEDYRIPVLAT
jgi:transposase